MSTTLRNSRQVSCTCTMSSHPRQAKMWDNTSGGNSVMCLCDHVAVTFVSCEDSPPSGGCLMLAFFATGSIVIGSSIGYNRFRPKRYPMVPCIRLLLYIRNNFIGHPSRYLVYATVTKCKHWLNGQQSILFDDIFQSENSCAGGARICRSAVVDTRR